MGQKQAAEFSRVRSILWPIHRHEFVKIIPLICILFLICFSYSILRNLKDSVMVTTCGAEVIPFVKLWVLLPMAIILTYGFSKLSARYSQEQVVYIVITGFLAVYALFAFVLYPFEDWIHPHAYAKALKAILPQGFAGFIEMLRYWSYTLFYVMAELWSSLVMAVIFWGFMNEITKLKEAKRFYSVLAVASNFAAVVAGQTANFFALEDKEAWGHTTKILVVIVILSGIGVMAIFWWMNHYVLIGSEFEDLHSARREVKKKKRLSLGESLSYLSNSKYLLSIATIVVSYNLVINLIEVVWKSELKQLYPDALDYNRYMNNLTSCIGLFSTITAFFMTRILNRQGWTFMAMITPVIMLVTSIGFFGFYFFKDSLSGFALSFLGVSPLMIIVFFGGAQNCLSKAAKYSVFDTSKELVFIPLEYDVKLKGKAAIDGVGSRFGKSGGSVIHQGLLMVFGQLSYSAPYVAAILMSAIVGWIFAVKYLGVQFEAISSPVSSTTATAVETQPQQLQTSEEQPATA